MDADSGIDRATLPEGWAKSGCPTLSIETRLLRVFFPDLGSEAMSRFAGIALNDDRIPDETLSLTFGICLVAAFNSDCLSSNGLIGLIGLILFSVKKNLGKLSATPNERRKTFKPHKPIWRQHVYEN